jgi:hypothetical protein
MISRSNPRQIPLVVANSSVFELGKKPEQIATQPAAVATRDPGGACPIERLGDGIRGRNQPATSRYSDLLRSDTR